MRVGALEFCTQSPYINAEAKNTPERSEVNKLRPRTSALIKQYDAFSAFPVMYFNHRQKVHTQKNDPQFFNNNSDI